MQLYMIKYDLFYHRTIIYLIYLLDGTKNRVLHGIWSSLSETLSVLHRFLHKKCGVNNIFRIQTTFLIDLWYYEPPKTWHVHK